jgi:hypothetical protein
VSKFALVVFLVGCGSPETREDTDTPTSTPTNEPTTPPITTPPTGTTTPPPTTTPTVPFDCATVPHDPVSIGPVAGGRAYHDILFDTAGNLIGNDNDALVKITSAGDFGLFAPGIGTFQGMDWLLDGDIVAASLDTNSLVRVNAAGAASILASGIDAYGVMVAPDGAVFAADNQKIYRVDPTTGQQTTIVDSAGITARVMDFSPDYTRLYVGTQTGNQEGTVYSIELGPDYLPIAGPKKYATGAGKGYNDGLGVDICGNVYVADYNTRALYRVWTTGEVQTLMDPDDIDNYGHGMEWGNGIGGWSETALFLPQPYNDDSVVQIELGVPSRRYAGAVINAGATGTP